MKKVVIAVSIVLIVMLVLLLISSKNCEQWNQSLSSTSPSVCYDSLSACSSGCTGWRANSDKTDCVAGPSCDVNDVVDCYGTQEGCVGNKIKGYRCSDSCVAGPVCGTNAGDTWENCHGSAQNCLDACKTVFDRINAGENIMYKIVNISSGKTLEGRSTGQTMAKTRDLSDNSPELFWTIKNKSNNDYNIVNSSNLIFTCLQSYGGVCEDDIDNFTDTSYKIRIKPSTDPVNRLSGICTLESLSYPGLIGVTSTDAVKVVTDNTNTQWKIIPYDNVRFNFKYINNKCTLGASCDTTGPNCFSTFDQCKNAPSSVSYSSLGSRCFNSGYECKTPIGVGSPVKCSSSPPPVATSGLRVLTQDDSLTVYGTVVSIDANTAKVMPDVIQSMGPSTANLPGGTYYWGRTTWFTKKQDAAYVARFFGTYATPLPSSTPPNDPQLAWLASVPLANLTLSVIPDVLL